MVLNNLQELRQAWLNAERAMLSTVQALPQSTAGLTAFQIAHNLRFEQAAFNPLAPERSLNLTEHLNQLFTCLVSFAAVYDLHTNLGIGFPITLNIGARAGFDIEAGEGTIKGECFAAVTPNNNRKLENDIARLRDADATRKFLYYYSPSPIDYEEDGIQIISLAVNSLNFPGV